MREGGAKFEVWIGEEEDAQKLIMEETTKQVSRETTSSGETFLLFAFFPLGQAIAAEFFPLSSPWVANGIHLSYLL